jgi:hypothetical protein
MASRDFLKHVVSTSEPVGSTLGDQWYNPTTNILRARLAVNGTSVAWVQTYPPVASTTSSLINFVESNSIVSPNDTIPVAAITAGLPAYANVDVALVTRGTGAITAQIPDNTTNGGNKRGSYAVDFQRTRTSAANVAQGNFSVIVGGNNNSINASSLQYSVIVGGNNNTITGAGGWSNQVIVGGSSNTITYANNSGIVAGLTNRISPSSYMFNYAFIGAGANNTADSDRSSIVGGESNTTTGYSSFIGGGRSNANGGYWGFLGGGRLNTISAPIDISFASQATKTRLALSVDNANIRAGMIYANRQNNGNLGTDGDIYVVSYAAAGGTNATSSGSGNGATYTLLFGGGVTYAIDTWVTIAGVTLTSGSISGTWLVTASSAGSVSFASTSTGTISVQGTIRQSTTVVINVGAQQTYNSNGALGAQGTLFYPGAVLAGGVNNIASGSYSVVGGGGDYVTATNRNTASGDWSTVSGGQKNTASGLYSAVASGQENLASGSYSVVAGGQTNGTTGGWAFVGGGQGNTAGYNWGAIGGGRGNQVTYAAGAIMGGAYGSTRNSWGYHAFPACYAPISTGTGVSQGGMLIVARETADATPVVLRSETSAVGPNNQLSLINNSAYYFKGSVIAGVTGAGATKAWRFEGAIKRGASAAATSIVGAVTKNIIAADAGAATWDVSFTADTTNGALAVTVTGQAGATIRWVCKLETTEMTF